MGCVNPDGTMTGVAQRVLRSLEDGATVQEAAQAASVPIYRVRASLRELEQAGLAYLRDGAWTLTEEGRSVLAA